MRNIFITFTIALICFNLAQMQYVNYYESPPNDQFLYVHLIPHTHDDVGWLKTPDDYYYGNKEDIARAGVQYIITSVIANLQKNPTYKFIYVEIAFFYKWWNEQNDNMKNIVRQLVQNGQLEFINGGWSMNDEGATYYEDIIDQMTIGHQWLLQTFGIVPTIGWQIDPFGHSSSQAALFSLMGFNGFFVGRIDHYDVLKRQQERNFEMIWHPRQESLDDNYIFFRWIDSVYGPPSGLCFDQRCNDEPVMDDTSLENYNLDSKAQQLTNYLRSRSTYYYNSSIYMQTLGGDFYYQEANKWYRNMDKLIKYVNSHQDQFNMQIFYSTPSQYLLHVHTQHYLNQRKFTRKLDDFLPITEVPEHGYQAGYFTSRVALKGLVYDVGRYMQLARTYLSLLKLKNMSPLLAKNENGFLTALAGIEQAMGVLMHHDAITGTEKQAVANDYVYNLYKQFTKYNNFLFAVLREQSYTNIKELLQFQWCRWNASTVDCKCVYDNLINNKTVVVAVYNQGLSAPTTLKVKVPNVLVDIRDINNKLVEGEIICANKTLSYDCDLYFYTNMSQFTLTYFKITPNKNSQTTKKIKGQSLHIWNFKKSFSFDGNQKSLQIGYFTDKIQYTYGSKVQKFELNYNQYHSYNGISDNSGAYVFRPADPTVDGSISYNKFEKKTIFIGDKICVLLLEGNHADTQIRFYSYTTELDQVLEVQTHIYSLPDQGVGTEMVMHLEFDINNQQKFYTDSNGLEMMERQLNYRPTFDMDLSEPAAGNFFPVNKMITINDTNNQVTVINDRSQAGTSLKSGQIELMIHRRLFSDDGHGVNQDLNEFNENGIGGLEQKVRHWIVFSDNDPRQTLSRLMQWKNDQQPLMYYATSGTTTFSQGSNSSTISIGQVPEKMKYYMKYLGNNTYIMRLNNLYYYDSSYIYPTSQFNQIIRYTLTANQLYDAWQKTKMQWNEVSTDNQEERTTSSETEKQSITQIDDLNSQILVKWLQIQTYVITTQPVKEQNVYEDI